MLDAMPGTTFGSGKQYKRPVSLWRIFTFMREQGRQRQCQRGRKDAHSSHLIIHLAEHHQDRMERGWHGDWARCSTYTTLSMRLELPPRGQNERGHWPGSGTRQDQRADSCHGYEENLSKQPVNAAEAISSRLHGTHLMSPRQNRFFVGTKASLEWSVKLFWTFPPILTTSSHQRTQTQRIMLDFFPCRLVRV